MQEKILPSSRLWQSLAISSGVISNIAIVFSSDRSAGKKRQSIDLEVHVSSPGSIPPRILCVDDRVASLEVRRALLTQAGYDVLLASDPPSAIAIVEKVLVDLVILDYDFPGHISGLQLAQELRSWNPKLRLIMLSGYPNLPDSVMASVDVLILKGGGTPGELLNAVARLIGSSRAGAGRKEPEGFRQDQAKI